MSDGDQRGGTGPRGRRPSRRMRERADEMADLLAHAAPAVRAHRRRRSAAIPAAVVALGALTVGGVGVAVGLDNEPAGAVTAPSPSAPLEGAPPVDPSPATDVPVTGALADERTDAVDRVDATDAPDSSSPRADAPRRAAAAPRAAPLAPRTSSPTTTDRDGGRGDEGDDRDDETTRSAPGSTPRSDDESPEESTPPRTRPRSDSSGERSGDGSDRSAGPGSVGRGDRTDLRADSRGTGTVLPSSPTGDGG